MKRPLTLTFVLLLAAACGGKGNSGKVTIPDELMLEIPWTNGRPPIRDATGAPIVPSTPVWPKIASGLADPGWGPVNCKAQEGLEFAFVETFEPRGDESGLFDNTGYALAWSSYDDFSDRSFRSPGELNWYGGLTHDPEAWGLPAQNLAGLPSCNGPSNWALHYVGGRFDRFGAGLSHPLGSINGTTTQGLDNCVAPLCPDAPEDGEPWPSGIPSVPEGKPAYDQANLKNVYDLSSYDGISFWARRGPEGQGALTVLIHDQYTSDDLNRENNTFCERTKACHSKCVNGDPCSDSGQVSNTGKPLFRCFDPADGPYVGGNLNDALQDALYPRCGASACTAPGTFTDPDFEEKECLPFTFQMHESDEYCFDPGEEPADSGMRCGDGYAYTVTTSLEWRFFKVPFSELRQQGFGKISKAGLDLKSASTLVFTYTHGWVDSYIDDIAFYREAK